MTTRDRIDALADERSARRRMGIPTKEIDVQLEAAWSTLREEKVAATAGRREDIIARARVERELEKLTVD